MARTPHTHNRIENDIELGLVSKGEKRKMNDMKRSAWKHEKWTYRKETNGWEHWAACCVQQKYEIRQRKGKESKEGEKSDELCTHNSDG